MSIRKIRPKRKRKELIKVFFPFFDTENLTDNLRSISAYIYKKKRLIKSVFFILIIFQRDENIYKRKITIN